jgi:hypothetical protein
MTDPVAPEPGPEIDAVLARRVRRMMLIAGLTSALGLGAILVTIGYRLFHVEGSAPGNIIATLPQGARIVSTAAAGDRLVLTVETGGGVEIRTFDIRTLKPVGRLSFASEP